MYFRGVMHGENGDYIQPHFDKYLVIKGHDKAAPAFLAG